MKKGKVQTIDIFSPENAMHVARQEIMNKAKEDGAECPCCGQFVKVYRRTINSTMARQLITAWHKHGHEWFHTRDVVLADSAGAGDFSKLENWGLIMRQPHVQGEDGKRTSGMWKITALGADFINGKSLVPQYVFIFNGEKQGAGGGEIHIQHALGKKFDYREIMGWTGGAKLSGQGLPGGQTAAQ